MSFIMFDLRPDGVSLSQGNPYHERCVVVEGAELV